MKILVIFIIILIILIISIILVNNTIIKKENNINNAFSSMDVYLKKRYDLIPNLVECVKGYMKHENDILEKIVLLRTSINKKHDETLINKSNQLDKELTKLFGIVENYPNLKSNENFLNLQDEMNEIEDEISASRRTYNAHVNNYNIYIKRFPTSIISSILGYKKKQLFVISEEERKNKNWMKYNEK